MFSYLLWNADPELFTIGALTPRWYGLLFALGFLLGQQVLIRMFKAEGKPESDVETLTVYMVLSTIVGARLGHCLFYEPETYLADPIRILKIWEGGLASHGAAIAIFFALYFYARNKKGQSYLWVTDRMVVTVALAGCCIRLGNLMNSEIIGKPSDVPWAFVFARSANDALTTDFGGQLEATQIRQTGQDTTVGGVPYTRLAFQTEFQPAVDEATANDLVQRAFPAVLGETSRFREVNEHIRLVSGAYAPTVARKGDHFVATFYAYGKPRHPAQLYEAMSCLVLFFLLYRFWSQRKENTPEGSITGLFMVGIFTLRFFYEFLKEPQVDFEREMVLNMGQWLSIPAVIFGLTLLVLSRRTAKQTGVRA
ncbi:MAG: prolipoprotein diacylglyceryl transferase [Ferruginibacter sp.]|nr:prolipoprotein diacylglyceryl transferase [Cytophagales bacterium]